MNDKELSGKSRLKEALQFSDQAYVDKHPPMETDVRYSKKHLKYMARLTRQTVSPIGIYARKYVAALMAAVLLLVCGSVTISAVRAPLTEFLETVSSSIFKDPNPSQSDDPHTEHDFSVLATDDPNKHYYRCADERCKERLKEEFHTYVPNEEKRRLECSVCGRVAN